MAASVVDIVSEVEELLSAHERARRDGWYVLANDVLDEMDDTGGERWYYIPIVFPNGSPDDIGEYQFLSEVEDEIAKRHRGERVRILLVPAI